MHETESVGDGDSRQEFEELLRQAEAEWLEIVKETSAQLTKGKTQEGSFQK